MSMKFWNDAHKLNNFFIDLSPSLMYNNYVYGYLLTL